MPRTGRGRAICEIDATDEAKSQGSHMNKFMPYLIGGLVMLAVDNVPAATNHLGAVSAAIWAGQAPTVLSTRSTVVRARKGDRLPGAEVAKSTGTGQSREQARETPKPQRASVPVGCDPSFSPVASPTLAHVTGRCFV
jgi:hypothetical protein